MVLGARRGPTKIHRQGWVYLGILCVAKKRPLPGGSVKELEGRRADLSVRRTASRRSPNEAGTRAGTVESPRWLDSRCLRRGRDQHQVKKCTRINRSSSTRAGASSGILGRRFQRRIRLDGGGTVERATYHRHPRGFMQKGPARQAHSSFPAGKTRRD